MPSLRTVIESRVRGLVASAEPGAPMLDDPGDAGLFGPDAACWKVHGDFTSMMVGGVAALLMQMLHPRALAGVWDHSNFRDDMAGRLRRTANFIAGTTYGTTGRAEQLLARVRGIHEQVRGTAPGVGAYAADDPDLLTWVHVCEVSSFLAGYRRYRDPAFPPAEQDRYFAEVSLIAEKLGARDVPKSRAAVAAYLQAVRPQLVADGRTREVAQAILTAAPKAGGGTHLVGGLFMQAAIDLLPDWAARMHGLHVSTARRPAIRLGVGAAGAVLRWSLRNSAETRARRRTSGLYDHGEGGL
jgi:uncharacterized protein (DUF2236 family)